MILPDPYAPYRGKMTQTKFVKLVPAPPLRSISGDTPVRTRIRRALEHPVGVSDDRSSVADGLIEGAEHLDRVTSRFKITDEGIRKSAFELE